MEIGRVIKYGIFIILAHYCGHGSGRALWKVQNILSPVKNNPRERERERGERGEEKSERHGEMDMKRKRRQGRKSERERKERAE